MTSHDIVCLVIATVFCGEWIQRVVEKKNVFVSCRWIRGYNYVGKVGKVRQEEYFFDICKNRIISENRINNYSRITTRLTYV